MTGHPAYMCAARGAGSPATDHHHAMLRLRAA